VPLHVNRTIAALKEDIENNIKRDIGTDIAKIREEIARIHGDVERNGITLTELQSWAGRKETAVNDLISSVSQSRVSIASMEKGLRSDMELDLSSALTGMQLELLNFKTETSSTFKTLRDDMARSRTVPAPSPADPVVTASVLQGFATKENVERLDGRLQKVETDLQGSTIIERLDKLDSHLREVEGTAKTALADATAVVDTTIGIAGDMDTFTSTTRTIEEAMEALREQVASLHEQPSSGPNHAVSGLTSLVLGSDHDATNIVREDTRAGNDAIEDRLQSQERAIKSLTSQYENITTDFLHQRMSHWIAENYPDAPGFLNELNRMQGKQRQFEAFVNDMSWMSADTQQAIQQLLRDKDRLGHPNAWEEFGSIRKRIDIEAQTRTQENKALRDELATECADRKRLAAGLEPVHDAFGKILPEVRLLRNELNHLKPKVASMEITFDNLKPTVGLLQNELNHLKPKVASMEITFDNLKPTVEFLVTEFGGLKPNVQRLETEFGNLGPKVELLGPKVELLKATTDKLDTAKKLSDTSIRELNDQKGRLDKRLQDAETSIQKHRQDIDTQDQSIGERHQLTHRRHILIMLPT
jgi:chromosome segregation ATPase